MIIGKVAQIDLGGSQKELYAKIVDKFLSNGTHKYIVCTIEGDVKIINGDRLIKIFDLELSDLQHYDLQGKQH